jgi:hypothetical protein
VGTLRLPEQSYRANRGWSGFALGAIGYTIVLLAVCSLMVSGTIYLLYVTGAMLLQTPITPLRLWSVPELFSLFLLSVLVALGALTTRISKLRRSVR